MKKSLITVGCLALVLTAGLFAQAKGKGTKGKAAVAGDATKGKDLFDANCAVCHNAATAERKMGPGLKDLTKHPKLVNEETMNDANLMKFLNDGGNGMPGFADLLTTAEKAHIMAYLKSL